MLDEPRMTYLPDETVFSLIGRQHRLWGFSSTRSTARILFGNERCRLRHDFPRALDTLAARMDGGAGSAVDAAREHTLLRYYLPFRTNEDGQRALESMRRAGGAGTKNCMGLLRSGLAAKHPLKACPTCMREGLATHGWTYWQLQHQFPGVWFCPLHGEPLMVLKNGDCTRAGGAWALPTFELLDRNWATHLSDQEADCLAEFGSMTIRAVELARNRSGFYVRAVVQKLKIKMQQFGWINSNSGSIRTREASRSWLRYWSPIRAAPDLQFLHQPGEAARCFRDVLAQSGGAHAHPLQVLLAFDWLIGDVDVLVRACTSQDARELEDRKMQSRWGAPVERAAVWRRVSVPRRRLYSERPAAPVSRTRHGLSIEAAGTAWTKGQAVRAFGRRDRSL